MSTAGGRLTWVDTAKGLSILLVVMMHSAFGVGAETGGTGVLHWIIAFATPFRMPEFFLISGLFLSLVIARDWRPYADRRVVHYFYFYALWAAIHILFRAALGASDPVTAASYLAWAVIEPYGVLWFIYMLAVFSAAAKLCWQARLPHWLVLAVAATLQIAPIATGWGLVDQFCAYFVFFYAGYALAPMLFAVADWAGRNVVAAALGLAVFGLVNAALVFSDGFAVLPDHVEMGLAALPGLNVVLAAAGSVALCMLAALLAKARPMAWLTWLGGKSIVVYLAFTLPMAITREILLRLGLISDTSVLSIVVMTAAVIGPLVLWWLAERTGRGRFLFTRPRWATITRSPVREANAAALRTPAQ